MSLTPSTMLELGATAPQFSLRDGRGTTYSLAEKEIDKGLLVIFMCNHCPYVKHILDKLQELIQSYQHKGIEVVAINSNDFNAYPDDNPDRMAELAEQQGFSFPYLVDGSQEVAKAYKAACTPDIYLFNGDLKLVYRGQFDSSRPKSNIPVTGEDLTRAVDQLAGGEKVDEEQLPSMGCNIKWKSGNEPAYFNS